MVNATKELVAAEMVDADRPEAHLNLGLLDLRRRQMPEAMQIINQLNETPPNGGAGVNPVLQVQDAQRG